MVAASAQGAATYVAARAALDSDAYNPEIASALEACVSEQVTSNTYDFEINLGLLKVYQFFPETLKEDVVVQILGKALMNLPSVQFQNCLCVIPKRIQSIPAVEYLIEAAQNLETANFEVPLSAIRLQPAP
jgi:translation initiation factor 3 subunit K